jgi:DNA-binding NtrC family response regulator
VFKVLIVDDEAGFRAMLSGVLAGRGIYVLAVADGAQAIDCLQNENFDVIVTDLSMPRIQGLALLEAAKTICPETRVIIITGFSTVETAVQAMRDGAFDFLLKPFDLPHLVARIHQAALSAQPSKSPE